MALRLAYTRPDLVAALVSLEGGPTEKVATPEFRSVARYVPWIKFFGGIKVIRRVLRRTLLASSGDTSWVTEGVVYGYTAGTAANAHGTWANAGGGPPRRAGRPSRGRPAAPATTPRARV